MAPPKTAAKAAKPDPKGASKSQGKKEDSKRGPADKGEDAEKSRIGLTKQSF